MKTLQRMWRHLSTGTGAGRRAFPPDSLRNIQESIARGEAGHRAEVRLAVEPALDMQDVLRGVHSRQRARELFSDYRVWDTEENTGILIYINLADHKVEIVADRAVNRVIAPAEWQEICRTMTGGFGRGEYESAVLAALDVLNALLRERLPAGGDRTNQLSNRPLML